MKGSSNPAIKLELKPNFHFTHISVTAHKSNDLCLYPRFRSFWLTYRKFSPGRLDTKTTRQEAATPVIIVSEAPSELLRSPDQRLPGNHSDGSSQPCYSTHEQSDQQATFPGSEPMQVSPEAIDGYAVSTRYASTTEYVRPRAGPGPGAWDRSACNRLSSLHG